MRQLYPTSAEMIDSPVYADLVLPAGPDDRPLVVLNMVSTVDGKVAVGGRAAGIGSHTDRLLMRQLYPRSADVPGAEAYADLAFPPAPPDRPLVVLNMVSTVDGKVAGAIVPAPTSTS